MSLIGAEGTSGSRSTLRAVWIRAAGCSSHCVIGRIMFRDSLSLLHLHVFCLSGSQRFSILKTKRGQRAVGFAPPFAALLLQRRRSFIFFIFSPILPPAGTSEGGQSSSTVPDCAAAALPLRKMRDLAFSPRSVSLNMF